MLLLFRKRRLAGWKFEEAAQKLRVTRRISAGGRKDSKGLETVQVSN